MNLDGRRLRRHDRDVFGLNIRVENPSDVLIIDRIIQDHRNPSNRQLLHLLLETYKKHNKLDIMT
jgi:hypothetical protein